METRTVRRKRVRLIVVIAVAVVLFLAIATVLARFLTVENLERDDDLALIQAQTRGDAAAMVAQLSGCARSSACVVAMHRLVANHRLRRPGAIKILNLESPTAYTLTGASGRTRFAWTVIGTLPVVQCIGVRRTGNFLSGIHVSLTSLSGPIPNEGYC